MSASVKKGDRVVILAGDDKGKTGEVLKVNPRAGKVLVQGINRVYRHLRPSRQNPQGGRIQKEMPIDISNVLPVDPKTSKPTRIGVRASKDGSRERYAKKSGESLGLVKKTKSK